MRVYVCAGQLLLPVSLKTRHEEIGYMCVTALVVGFNGRCAGKERKEPRVLLIISLIKSETCSVMRRDEWRQTKRRNLKGGERIDWLSSVEEAQHINYSHVQ